MKTVKARIQGNAVVVTIPKTYSIKPGTEFSFEQVENGAFLLTPAKKIPDSLDELFKNWHGEYKQPDDLKGWQDADPKGDEIW